MELRHKTVFLTTELLGGMTNVFLKSLTCQWLPPQALDSHFHTTVALSLFYKKVGCILMYLPSQRQMLQHKCGCNYIFYEFPESRESAPLGIKIYCSKFTTSLSSVLNINPITFLYKTYLLEIPCMHLAEPPELLPPPALCWLLLLPNITKELLLVCSIAKTTNQRLFLLERAHSLQ